MTCCRDRVYDAFAHKTPDRTPFFEYALKSDEITRLILGT